MDLDAKKILKTLNPRKVWVPVGLGLGIVAYLFWSDPTITADKLTLVFDAAWMPVALASIVFFARFAGYIFRIKSITKNELSWTSSLYVIILWEFASAVTPSVVGGTAVAVFILWKEGIKPGKALGFVLLTAIFDNLFFVLAAPITLFLGMDMVFPQSGADANALESSMDMLFFVSYSLISIYTFVMAFALLINPRLFKWVLIKITSTRLLKKWRYAAYERGTEMILASEQLKGMGKRFWLYLSLSTLFIWSSRYLLLNFLMASFTSISFLEHITIFGKQIILWVVMLISPTPGSSGTAEYFFPIFFNENLGDYTLIVNLLWRLFTYYPYLLLGAIFLPRWVKRVFFVPKEKVVSQ
ncbi:MAG: flippase-like domain-containing protein [Cyclobacteriaceae bacterium]|nr:flippase-like domain-containing protein [Cyclobacteriaceae bacterium]